MRFNARNKFGLIAFVASLMLGVGHAHAQTPIKFSMDWTYQGSQAIWFVAQDSGCFTREGLNVTIDRGFGAGDVLSKIGAGAYDIGFSDFNTLIQFNGENPNSKLISVLMVYDATPTSIATLKSSGVTKPADLVGKQIASPTNDASRILFPIFAKANGIDPAKVNWASTSPALRESMLARRQVDGTAGHMWTQLIGLRALGVKEDDINLMLYSKMGVDTFGSILVAKPSWAAANPRAVTSFIRCVAEGINGAIANPKAAIAALKKRDPLLDEAVETDRLLLSLSVGVLTENVKRNGLHTFNAERFTRAATIASEIFKVPMPEMRDIVDDKYLPPRKDLSIRHELTMRPR
jgi:NitT/TauT family transport system substrate-binding protein